MDHKHPSSIAHSLDFGGSNPSAFRIPSSETPIFPGRNLGDVALKSICSKLVHQKHDINHLKRSSDEVYWKTSLLSSPRPTQHTSRD